MNMNLEQNQMKDANREIFIVQNMLDSLYQCLYISASNKRIKEAKRILADIKIVKMELKKLHRQEHALGDALKEK